MRMLGSCAVLHSISAQEILSYCTVKTEVQENAILSRYPLRNGHNQSSSQRSKMSSEDRFVAISLENLKSNCRDKMNPQLSAKSLSDSCIVKRQDTTSVHRSRLSFLHKIGSVDPFKLKPTFRPREDTFLWYESVNKPEAKKLAVLNFPHKFGSVDAFLWEHTLTPRKDKIARFTIYEPDDVPMAKKPVETISLESLEGSGKASLQILSAASFGTIQSFPQKFGPADQLKLESIDETLNFTTYEYQNIPKKLPLEVVENFPIKFEPVDPSELEYTPKRNTSKITCISSYESESILKAKNLHAEVEDKKTIHKSLDEFGEVASRSFKGPLPKRSISAKSSEKIKFVECTSVSSVSDGLYIPEDLLEEQPELEETPQRMGMPNVIGNCKDLFQAFTNLSSYHIIGMMAVAVLVLVFYNKFL